jgi:hypothetical protein
MASIKARTCYLCGEALTGDKRLENDDHVPPQQLLTKSLRRKYRIKFITLPTHSVCNSSYSLDEEYFTHCLIPFGKGSEAGDAIWLKAMDDYKSGKTVALPDYIVRSAKRVVFDVPLPPGRIWLDYDLRRIERVIGKVIKGLHFLDTQTYMNIPEDIGMRITFPGQAAPADFNELLDNLPVESRGNHQGVFAYRSWVVDELHYWAMLFWDRVMITASFKTN